MRGARIAGEERVGAEHDGGVHAVDQLRHGAVVQRRRIEIDLHAGDQRQDQPDRQSERMKHRQHVEHLVGAPEVDAGRGLRGVRQHVAVGQHDALGRALRSGREQDRGRVVGVALGERLFGGDQRAQLVGRRNRRAHVLQINDLHLRFDTADQRAELTLVDEGARRDDRRHLRGPAGRQNVGGARREVDHRRHPAGRHQPDDRHRRPVGVRQHHADCLALGRERHELAAEHGGTDQQSLVGQGAGHRVLDRGALHAMDVRGLDHRLHHGAVGRGGAEHEIRHDLVERRARRLPAIAALEAGIDRKLDRLEDGDGDLGKPAALDLGTRQPAERRLLEPVDAHRHDMRVGLVGDQAGAVIDFHQAARDGDASLGENDKRVAGLDRVDQRARRHRLGRVERHRAGDLEERLDPPALRDAVVDREHRLAFEQRDRERGVEEAHVIERDDRVRPGLLQVVEAAHLEPVERAKQDREEIA